VKKIFSTMVLAGLLCPLTAFTVGCTDKTKTPTPTVTMTTTPTLTPTITITPTPKTP
jgi:hypothetical protein